MGRRPAAVATGLALLVAACGSSASDSSPLEPPSTRATSTSAASGPGFDADLRAAVPNQPAPLTVAFYGDSLAHSAQEQVENFLTAGLRLRVLPRVFPGTALCDWFGDLETDRTEQDLWAAILLFTNNTFTECMTDEAGDPLTGPAGFERFARDLATVVADLRAADIRVYLPTLPVTRADAEAGRNEAAGYNELFAELAEDDEGVIVVDAAAAVLGPNGEYVEALPCLPVEPCVGGVDADGIPVNLVREPDGAHFCSGGFGDGVDILADGCPAWASGAFRYAGALTAPIIEDAYRWWSEQPASQQPPPTVPQD